MRAIHPFSGKMVPLLALLILIGFNQNAIAGTTETTWKSNKMTIDGNFEDWKDIPNQFNEDLNLVYSVINDDSCLYLMLRFQDPRLARKMNTGGSTLWLNSNNKKNKDLGIRYFNDSVPPEPERDQPPTEMLQMQNAEMNPVHGIVQMDGRFVLKEKDFTLPILQTAFTSAAAFQTGFYCFEYRIPFTYEKSVENRLKIKPGDKFKIGLEIEAMNPEMRAKMEERMKDRKPAEDDRPGGRMGGGPGGGMGGGRGGRMGGGRGMGQSDRAKMMENEEIWFTFKLAKQPK